MPGAIAAAVAIAVAVAGTAWLAWPPAPAPVGREQVNPAEVSSKDEAATDEAATDEAAKDEAATDEADSGAVPGPAPLRAAPTPSQAVRPDCVGVSDGALVADVDDDGCPEALRFAEGVLEAGMNRWTVGQAGDQVAVGDWWCTGSFTLALLRPADGTVFAFPGWAGPETALTVVSAGTVPGGQSLRAADLDGDGCHELAVERGHLPTQLVILPDPVADQPGPEPVR